MKIAAIPLEALLKRAAMPPPPTGYELLSQIIEAMAIVGVGVITNESTPDDAEVKAKQLKAILNLAGNILDTTARYLISELKIPEDEFELRVQSIIQGLIHKINTQQDKK